MPKFKIEFGLSNGDESEEIIEADNLDEAQKIAYEYAMEIANSWITYSAEPVEDEES